MVRKNNRWTQAKINELLDILIFDPDTNQCLNYEEAGEHFGVKKTSIKRVVIKLRKQGILPKYDVSKQRDSFLRPYTEDDYKYISAAFNAGASLREVAEAFGRTVNAMRCVRADLAKQGKIKYHFQPWSKLQTEKLIINWQSDSYFVTENANYLADITGHPKLAVYSKIEQLRESGCLPAAKRVAPPEGVIELRTEYHNKLMNRIFWRHTNGKIHT
ncbi:hypothetical protein IWT25_00727 [Secundilactobacillus pentosiphilus]|uniref:Uncharacterized protein n=1 Tax=Secundilactobacillus pentosiphilus TaxID=1714682 RepID=A0A1Z5IUJ1_9LACO|nr:hypothetical protein [Secundilactobacillus pentosiphilus]GAX05423.1 hypothetical protein IWT25_00727 [Secundilactobacillus pentosiphilus]